jgi:hypothetical protein
VGYSHTGLLLQQVVGFVVVKQVSSLEPKLGTSYLIIEVATRIPLMVVGFASLLSEFEARFLEVLP